LNPLEGREPGATGIALPPPPNRTTVLDGP
jgi:hypothetical protein